MENDDLHQLLLHTHRGERDAAVRFYRLLAPRLLAYARTIARDDAAEDAVQQVFVSLLGRSRDELDAVEDVLAWMVRLTRNTLLNHLRSGARRAAREAAWGRGVAPVSPGPGHDDLLVALARLDPDQRELLVLKHIAGLTFDQMATSLQTSRSTLASRYSAALNRVRSLTAQGVAHG